MNLSLGPQDQLALAIGRVQIAWNELHYEYFLIYQQISRVDWLTAEKDFFSIRNDRKQRDCVRKIARKISSLDQNAVAALIVISDRVDALAASQRNMSAHTMWQGIEVQINGEQRIKFAPKNPSEHRKNLFDFEAGPDFGIEFNNLAVSLKCIRKELHQIWRDLGGHVQVIPNP
jgi:hypothetical protein